tara:strand:- start:312 stop:827 length:516 start_codon:yes stop_codon:yes gene_type:complete
MEPFRMGWRPCLASWLDMYTEKEQTEPIVEEDADSNDSKSSSENLTEEEKIKEMQELKEEKEKKKKMEKEKENEAKWHFSKEERLIVEEMFEYLIDPSLCFVRRMCMEQAPTFDQTLVLGTIRLMECVFEEILVNADGHDSREMSGKPSFLIPSLQSTAFNHNNMYTNFAF